MKNKYEKPQARNLGEVLPGAEGMCMVGSTANLEPPTSSCRNGPLALGAVCNDGSIPGGTGCVGGTTPAFFGCRNGEGASSPGCSTGYSPVL